jgi:Carlavirus putative nucleic acid binding protein.
MESVSNSDKNDSTEETVLNPPVVDDSKQTVETPPKRGMKQRSMFQGKSLYALRRRAKRGKLCPKCLREGCPGLQPHNPEEKYHYMVYYCSRRTHFKADRPTGWKAD